MTASKTSPFSIRLAGGAGRVGDYPAHHGRVGANLAVLSSFLRRLTGIACREPLVGFALAGCLVFLIFHWLPNGDKDRIVITQAMIDDLYAYRSELLDRPLTSDEKETLVAEFVNREILLREAVARGLHRQDAQVRKRLIEKMNFLLEEEPEAPTARQLEALFEGDNRRFYTPALISFEHVYFTSDRERARETLDGIRQGDIDPGTAGETFWLGRRLEYYSASELLTLFGFDFVNRLRDAGIGTWQGPIRSGRGQHLVRVIERREPEPLPEPQLRQALEREWMRLRRLESRDIRLRQMRGHYEIALPKPALTD